MSITTKKDILDAIRRTAKENGGVPLGKGRFQRETGINEYECLKFWPNFGEAQREAGFEPNTLQAAHDIEFLRESIVALMREIGRFPTNADLIGKRHRDASFPSPGSFKRFGNKREMAKKISEHAEQKGYADVVEMCALVTKRSVKTEDDDVGLGNVVGEATKLTEYAEFLNAIKSRIRNAQISASRILNKGLVGLYWSIGKDIVEKQEKLGWGKSVVEQLSKDLKREFDGESGFSTQNLWYMRQIRVHKEMFQFKIGDRAKLINCQWDFSYDNNRFASREHALNRDGKNGDFTAVLTTEHTFPKSGIYSIAARVQDNLDGQATVAARIEINENICKIIEEKIVNL